MLFRSRKAVDIPLVLHGGSGIPDEDVKRALSLGVAKMNVHAELGQAAMEGIREDLDTNFLMTQQRVRSALKRRALEKIELLGATGRAASMPRILDTPQGGVDPLPDEHSGSCT